MSDSPAARRRLVVAGAALTLVIAAATPDPARAQAKLEASYTISVARIPIGSVTAGVEVAAGEYTVSMSGRAAGLMRVLASGEGSLAAHGTIKDNRLWPASYTSKTTSDDDTLDVKMVVESGRVMELTASAPPPSDDRVPLTDAHRREIVDPLTAILIPAAETGEVLSPAACQRTLPIFDGRRRYDLKLTYMRMDRVRAEKGYAGPVVVCAIAMVPIAGYRTSSTLAKYLSDGRDIEIALAPIAGTRLLAPFRVSVANMLGNLVVQANRFESLAPASVRASATAAPKAE